MKTLLIGNTKAHGAKRLKEEFEKRELIFDTIFQKNITFHVAKDKVALTDKEGNDLLSYDVYMFRGMGDSERELAVIARYLKYIGKVVVEDVFAERGVYVDKFLPRSIEEDIPVPDYHLVFSKNSVSFGALKYPVIVKGLDGSMGNKVDLIKTEEEFKEFLNDNKKFSFPLILQQYLQIDFDYRVMVVDGNVLGVMKRYKKEGDFLTIRAGGKREAVNLPEEALNVALRAAHASELTVAGVDLVEQGGVYYRLEVNMSPQFRVFERTTGVNIAEAIVRAVIKKYEEKGK